MTATKPWSPLVAAAAAAAAPAPAADAAAAAALLPDAAAALWSANTPHCVVQGDDEDMHAARNLSKYHVSKRQQM